MSSVARFSLHRVTELGRSHFRFLFATWCKIETALGHVSASLFIPCLFPGGDDVYALSFPSVVL